MSDKPKIKKSDATRQQIFEAALELIGQYGIDNVTLSDIARKAKVSKGLFYYYFSNKEEILSYTLQKGEDFYAKANEAAADKESFLEALEAFYKTTYEAIQVYGKEFARSTLINSLNTSRSRFTNDETMIKYLKPIFEKAVVNGEIKTADFDMFIQNLMAFLLGTEFIWCVNDMDETLADYIVSKIPSFIKGL